MIKTYKISADIYFDLQNVKSVIVKANTERKAKIKAKEIFRKKYNEDLIDIISCELIDEKNEEVN